MDAVSILNNHNLKRTSCREGIINIVMSANNALSKEEIMEQLEGNYDRTTFYRSFKTLEEHKIIHKIVIDNQLVKYAIDKEVSLKEEHAHFYCNECHTVKCLESVLLQRFQLPYGYSEDETEIIIKGTCAMCKRKTDFID